MTDDQEDREKYRELLEELRTMIPGAQVLFAFLLTAPFAARFSEIDRLGKILFVVALLAVAAAVFLFLAPAAYHRITGRADRRSRLAFGVRTALVGMALLGLSITCSVFVVVRFLFGFALASALATAAAAVALLVWVVLPALKARERRPHGGGNPTREEGRA